MKKMVLIAVSALALAGAGTATLWAWPIGAESPAGLGTLTGNSDRGAYLARMAGCIACHTDGENGGAPLAGGLELDTRFGTFRSPNLTTDPEDGIGAWTIADFDRAVRQGVSPDGEPYYPAFPYPFYTKLSEQDVADLWEAFQTVPARKGGATDHDLLFPYNLRFGLKAWRAMFLDLSEFTPEPEKSDAWNRGKYIVTGPAHCGACHTPRNFAGAREAELAMHGAEDLPGGGTSPSIESGALRDKGWTVEDLTYALKSGIHPDGDVFGGSMAEVVRDGTRFLSEDDRMAMAIYLLDEE